MRCRQGTEISRFSSKLCFVTCLTRICLQWYLRISGRTRSGKHIPAECILCEFPAPRYGTECLFIWNKNKCLIFLSPKRCLGICCVTKKSFDFVHNTLECTLRIKIIFSIEITYLLVFRYITHYKIIFEDKTGIFYNVTPCSQMIVHLRFKGTYCFHLQRWRMKETSNRKQAASTNRLGHS
jgi:hypothetical protein